MCNEVPFEEGAKRLDVLLKLEIMLASCNYSSLTHLYGVFQPVNWGRVDGTDHLQHAIEVVELLENLQDLNDP